MSRQDVAATRLIQMGNGNVFPNTSGVLAITIPRSMLPGGGPTAQCHGIQATDNKNDT